MEEFSFSTRIFFGEGALERLRRVQDKKVMIVTDRFMAGIGVPDKVAGHLTRYLYLTAWCRIPPSRWWRPASRPFRTAVRRS